MLETGDTAYHADHQRRPSLPEIPGEAHLSLGSSAGRNPSGAPVIEDAEPLTPSRGKSPWAATIGLESPPHGSPRCSLMQEWPWPRPGRLASAMAPIASAIAATSVASTQQVSTELPEQAPDSADNQQFARETSKQSEQQRSGISLPADAVNSSVAEAAVSDSVHSNRPGTSAVGHRSPGTSVSASNPISPESAQASGTPQNNSPDNAKAADESADDHRPQTMTFAQTLSLSTAQASDQVADKLIERLQQGCLDEANLGRSHFVFETPLPASRNFSDTVARAFASRLRDLGFLRFEWWTGKDWKEMPGRFCLHHDPMYDKYTMSVKVFWPEGLSMDQVAAANDEANIALTRRDSGPPAALVDDAVLAPILQQLHQTMALQQQLIIQSAAAQAAAEARAHRAEVRALVAERTCLQELRSRLGSVNPSTSASVNNGDMAAFAGVAAGAGCATGASVASRELVAPASDSEDCDEIDPKDLCGI